MNMEAKESYTTLGLSWQIFCLEEEDNGGK